MLRKILQKVRNQSSASTVRLCHHVMGFEFFIFIFSLYWLIFLHNIFLPILQQHMKSFHNEMTTLCPIDELRASGAEFCCTSLELHELFVGVKQVLV